MDRAFTISPQEILNSILAICGAISVIAGAAAVIAKCITTLKKPNQKQDERIESLENEVSKINEKLEKDHETNAVKIAYNREKIDSIEEANAVTQRALLALLSHAINGNDVDALRRAKTDLEAYLTKK